jgi:D-threonate/D-erythronate kinase
VIGVIADDLTGAAEIGAVGLRYGLRAEIILAGQAGGEANLVCVDTNSRSCSARQAARRAASAASQLRACGARWIYKKVDSVLRGNVTAELEAVMRRLGVRRALLVPANPSLGRTIWDGQYFSHGKPIHKTEFAKDPEHPRLSPKVLDLLGPSGRGRICVTKPGAPIPAEGILVGEARVLADLHGWAAQRSPSLLPAGGAEFFGALLANAGYRALERRASKTVALADGPHLFVCGTASQSSRRFISAARKRGTPVFSLARALTEGGRLTAADASAIAQRVIAALASSSSAILNFGLPPARRPMVDMFRTTHLTRIAELVLNQTTVSHVYVEGGTTAVELARRMGWARLTVVHELALGVATLGVGGAPVPRLTIKPGSYVWPNQIQDLTLRGL